MKAQPGRHVQLKGELAIGRPEANHKTHSQHVCEGRRNQRQSLQCHLMWSHHYLSMTAVTLVFFLLKMGRSTLVNSFVPSRIST